MDANKVNAEIRAIVDRWCERRELWGLSVLLPAWVQNNGLTDGWADLAAALRTVADAPRLPQIDRMELKRLYVTVDYAVRNRD